MPRTVLFVDPTCPGPYAAHTLATRAMGGTEATVVRVAEGLAGRGWRVVVAQRPRTVPTRSAAGVAYVGFDHKRGVPAVRADAVVLVRAHKLLPSLRAQHPDAALFLWLHCFLGSNRRALAALAAETRATVVAVSDTHRAELLRYLYQKSRPVPERWPPVVRIFNPIDDDLGPDGQGVDPDRLVFFSSPHKGLDAVLEAFRRVRAYRPSAHLVMANPGYLERKGSVPPGVRTVGALPHAAVMELVRGAFCVFYPQPSFAETFGLVFAEANAVGTPVLTHPVGAAAEVLGETLADRRQLIDATDPERAVERLGRWWAVGRPAVQARPEFRLTSVLDAWETALAETPSDRVERSPTTVRVEAGPAGRAALSLRQAS